MKTPLIAPDRAATAASGRSRKLKRGQEQISGGKIVNAPAEPLAIFNPPPFSHGLLEFRIHGGSYH
ncbi:MAG: hypothetical protein ABSA13_18620, partial [Beijerinckiaceae bacterium]